MQKQAFLKRESTLDLICQTKRVNPIAHLVPLSQKIKGVVLHPQVQIKWILRDLRLI